MVQQLRLVIADDDTLIRMNLKETLEALGYLVIGDVGDGQSAINLTRALRPDLVVLDIKMPKMDGIAAAKVLNDEQLAPVLLLTAYVERAQVAEACAAGVMSYIVKPFREADLMPAIELAVARYQAFRSMGQRAGDLAETIEVRRLVDRAKGVLMDTQGLKEQEAFRKIQQLSMNTRKSMSEIAQAILLTAQIE
jgi:AmiR/NasT family two-component response regulator